MPECGISRDFPVIVARTVRTGCAERMTIVRNMPVVRDGPAAGRTKRSAVEGTEQRGTAQGVRCRHRAAACGYEVSKGCGP